MNETTNAEVNTAGRCWGRRPPGTKRTATGTGYTDPPWHRIIDPPSSTARRTMCGKRLRGNIETAGGLPSDGPACRACVRAHEETHRA